MMTTKRLEVRLGKYQPVVNRRLDTWENTGFIKKLWEKDTTLWPSDPVTEDADRLGWLDLPEKMQENTGDFRAFADTIRSEGIRHVVLLGMGGSSLAAEVFKGVLGYPDGSPVLHVLDSTHPLEVQDLVNRVDLSRSLFLISSKSGTTLETLSLFRYFWAELTHRGKNPGSHFVAITDTGSPLEDMARERGFRRTFLAPSDVGGRFSALSDFGLVPAALIGVDIEKIIHRAMNAAKDIAIGVSVEKSLGLILGAVLGEVGRERDKLTLITFRSLKYFPAWVEQLVAESLGKDGKGIIPVVDEPPVSWDLYGSDRCFVLVSSDEDEDEQIEDWKQELNKTEHPFISISLSDRFDIGHEFFCWEIAVSAAASLMDTYPFDQPDVQLSKDLTCSAMQAGKSTGDDFYQGERSLCLDTQDQMWDALRGWLQASQEGDYIAIQAYLPRSEEIEQGLHDLRLELLKRTRLATTLGFGPRFLHSTGQLHKGGPGTGLFFQLVDEPEVDLPIPETDYSFATLIKAQSWGDFQALLKRQRNVIRIHLGRNILEGLEQIQNSLLKL